LKLKAISFKQAVLHVESIQYAHEE
jgi:hypothetical protein